MVSTPVICLFNFIRISIIVTLEMLTELEKNGGWLKLPSAVSPYIMTDYHIEISYLIRDAVISDYFFSLNLGGRGSAPRSAPCST